MSNRLFSAVAGLSRSRVVFRLAAAIGVGILGVWWWNVGVVRGDVPRPSVKPLPATVPTRDLFLSGTVAGTTLTCRVNEFSVNSDGAALSFPSPSEIRNIVIEVTSGTPTRIAGRLTAPTVPGVRLWLVNPNGIEISDSARIELPGDVVFATASEVIRAMATGSPTGLRFSRNATGGVTNSGVVTAVPGASVSLVGTKIGQFGELTAPGGTVNLAAVVPEGDVSVSNESGLTIPGAMKKRTDRSGSAGELENTGVIDVSGERAGRVDLTVPFGYVGGDIRADGNTGGQISIEGGHVVAHGTLRANGKTGDGGRVMISAARRVIQTAGGTIRANGGLQGKGGKVSVNGLQGVFSSGKLFAEGAGSSGGRIAVAGRVLNLVAASFVADGATDGGDIFIGGHSGPGSSSVAYLSENTMVRADAGETGKGGTVVVWATESTTASATVSARGGRFSGDGGFVELSGKSALDAGGVVNAGATSGNPGQVLLDPKNIVIDETTGLFPHFQLIDPNAGGGVFFGVQRILLNSGNVAVSKPFDNAGGTNAGAVYVYNRTTGALVSVLTGSTAEDRVSEQGLIDLKNGNFVILSRDWNNGTAADAGAVTWVDGATGLSGVIGSGNSLVGTVGVDQIGSAGVIPLTNGNYVVCSQNWDNGSAINAGAATWCNGTTGRTGPVNASNSLVGTATIHNVGIGGCTALTNGNYVINSRLWDNGTTANVGAVTWGNGTTGITGPVTTTNSLVGSTPDDQVGNRGIIALTNGNYAVGSTLWNNGSVVDAGAVTWCNGLGGTVGAVSPGNSLVGSTNADAVGNNLRELANGNYIVTTPAWDNGATADVGAATLGNGLGGTVGPVSTTNSLVGSTPGDQVGIGSAITLTNGNYIVMSRLWNNGAATAAGAATFCNGTTGLVATVSAANSLVGSVNNDNVGTNGQPLTNGNYVLTSSNCDVGGIVDAGAATFGNGTTGVSGAVSAANSLVGTTNADQVGSFGVFPLSNGNYVVASPNWNNGTTADVGAATWGNGTTGISGPVTTANSQFGPRAGDQIAFNGVRALTNGNYIVGSPFFDNGALFNVGAFTFGNGTTGSTGVVTVANSLVGSTSNDLIGQSSVPLADGSCLAISSGWTNGSIPGAGAMTLLNGTTGRPIDGSSFINSANSFLGTVNNSFPSSIISDDTASGTVIVAFLREGGSGRVFVAMPSANSLTFARGQSQTVAIRASFINSALNSGTNVVLQANNDITVNSPISSTAGSLTLQAGRSVLLNAALDVNGPVSVVANDTVANGVVDAQRDPGAAVITATDAVRSRTGAVTFDLRNGAGKTDATSGDLTIFTAQGASVTLNNVGPTAGSRVRATGTLASGGCSGASLCTAADGGGSVTINHPNSGADFLVGNAATNGTSGSIVTGSATVPVPTTILNAPGTFTSGNIAVTPGQAVPCSFGITPTSTEFPAPGGTQTVTITTAAGCAWSVTGTVPPWLSVNPASGTGSGSVTVTASANRDGTPRTATFAIAGQNYTANQAAADLVNGFLSLTTDAPQLTGTACGGYSNELVLTATLTNTSSTQTVFLPYFQVIELRETTGAPPPLPFRLLTADDATCSSGGLVGSVQSTDGASPTPATLPTLAPGQSTTVTFRIALAQVRRIRFFLNVFGGTTPPVTLNGKPAGPVKTPVRMFPASRTTRSFGVEVMPGEAPPVRFKNDR